MMHAKIVGAYANWDAREVHSKQEAILQSVRSQPSLAQLTQGTKVQGMCGAMIKVGSCSEPSYACRNGVNVLFWFAIDLVENSAGDPAIVSRGPPAETMVEIVHKLR